MSRSAVNDIDLPDGSDTLYTATYGRSVWTTSLAPTPADLNQAPYAAMLARARAARTARESVSVS